MSLDHEPRTTFTNSPEHSDKPAWYKRRSTKIGGAAAAVAGLVAAGALTLGGGSTEADHPRHETHASATPTPGTETSTSTSPETEAPSDVVLDPGVTPVEAVDASSLSGDSERQAFYDEFYNPLDANKLDQLREKNNDIRNQISAESDDAKFALQRVDINPFDVGSVDMGVVNDYLTGVQQAEATTSDVLSSPKDFGNYADLAREHMPQLSDPDHYLSKDSFDQLIEKALAGDKDAETDIYKHLVNWSQGNYTAYEILKRQMGDRIAEGKNVETTVNQNQVADLFSQESKLFTVGYMDSAADDMNDQNNTQLNFLQGLYYAKNATPDSIKNGLGYSPMVEAKDPLDGIKAELVGVNFVNAAPDADIGAQSSVSEKSQAEHSTDQLAFRVTYTSGYQELVILKTGPAPIKGGESQQAVIGWISKTIKLHDAN